MKIFIASIIVAFVHSKSLEQKDADHKPNAVSFLKEEDNKAMKEIQNGEKRIETETVNNIH